MTVGIVGSGPAATAVEAGLAETEIETERVELDAIGETTLAVVAGQAGDPLFEQANERALETDSRWIAVESGGIGGIPVVDTAVSCFGLETGCFECLSGRVNANLDRQSDPDATSSTHLSHFAGAVAAREVSQYIIEEEYIFGRVITPPFDEKRFLPLPNCLCDEGVDRTLDRGHVDCELANSLARAEQALDETVGIIQEVGEAESFPVPYYLARSCDTAGFSDTSAARDAAGVAIDWNSAFMKALGEGLERYCAGVYRTDEFEHAPLTDMTEAVPPSAFVCEADPDPSTPVEWVDGQELATSKAVSLPAEFVHHPPPASRYHSPVTTGLGLGNSSVEAILAGLYEVIERDAMMLSWYSTFEPLGLEIDSSEYETLINRAKSEDLTVTTLLLTQDVDIPVVAAAVQREEWPKLAFGTGAALDVSAGAQSALAEALQNWTELRGMGPEDAADALGEIGAYADEPGPAAAFADPDAAVPADAVGPDSVPTGEDELDAVLDRLDGVGLDAYAARLTTRDVEQLGFEAVRALVPAAQPLTFGEPVFSERAESVPNELGFEFRPDVPHHPFP